MTIYQSPSRTQRRTRRAILWSLLGCVVGAAAASAAFAPGVASGDAENHYGEPMVLDAGPSTTPFDVRVGCRMPRMGVAPWSSPGAPKGLEWEWATRRAMREMGVPGEAANTFIERVRRGTPDDVVSMRNSGGLSAIGNQAYGPSFATTWRKDGRYTVCHDSATSFADPAREEDALLYRVDHAGKTYHLAVFRVCGNVSRLYPAAPRLAAADAAEGLEFPATPDQPQADAAVVHEVPEPSTAALLALAAAGLFVTTRRK